MDFEQLAHVILPNLKDKLESSQGLSVFVRERKRFEGWIKVELCEILSKRFGDVVPEDKDIDVTFDDWAVELKPVTTNYVYAGVKTKTKNITNNIDDIVSDIEKLRASTTTNKAVLFVAFPLDHTKPEWKPHLKRISQHLRELKHENVRFQGNIPGTIYLGLVQSILRQDMTRQSRRSTNRTIGQTKTLQDGCSSVL
jgi:hypothetical protein